MTIGVFKHLKDVTKVQFDLQIDKYKKGLPHSVEVISQYIWQCTQNAPDDYETVRSAAVGIPAIHLYITENEQKVADMIASYKAANERMNYEFKAKSFWQGIAVSISAMVVVYMLWRAWLWLWPIRDMLL